MFNEISVLEAADCIAEVPITTSQPEHVPNYLKRSGQRTLVASGTSLVLGEKLVVCMTKISINSQNTRTFPLLLL